VQYKVDAPIPVHVPHSIVMYQWSTFWKENVHYWYMMMEWGTWTGMGAPTLVHLYCRGVMFFNQLKR